MNIKPYVILVGIDFSMLADRALEEGLGLASQRQNSELHALWVVPSSSMDAFYATRGYAPLFPQASIDEAAQRLHAHVQLELEKFRAKHPEGDSGFRVVSHVRFDSPARSLAQVASELAADLIIVGTHNRKGLERLLVGSVAECTVRYAHCPILVIPPEARIDDELKIATLEPAVSRSHSAAPPWQG
ncbi:MAG: universal stress protein [Pseudomonadota bacterium]